MSSKDFSSWYKEQKEQQTYDEEEGLLGSFSSNLNQLQESFSDQFNNFKFPNSLCLSRS